MRMSQHSISQRQDQPVAAATRGLHSSVSIEGHFFCGKRTATLVAWLILGLFLSDGTIVIDEDECIFVVGIGITLGTYVARTEVA